MKLPHGGDVWKYDNLPIDFSANINPLGPSKLVNNVLEKWKIVHYPPQNLTELKTVLAEYSNIEEENITVGNGSIELIKDFCSVYLTNRDTTVIAQPTFNEYERYSLIYGCNAINVLPERGLLHTADDIIDGVDKDAKIIFVCRPNNPTGGAVSETDLLKVLDFALEKSIYVFLDEAFIDFSSLNSLASRVLEYENLFVLKTLTKFFAMPGLRIGYGIGNPNIVERLEEIQAPWNINIFAHDASIVSIKDRSYIKRTKKSIEKEKIFLKRKFEELGIKIHESHANFFLLEHNWNSKQVQKDLIDKGFLVRDCSMFHGLDTRFIRVGVRGREDNLKLVDTMRDLALQGVKKGEDCEYYPCHFEGQDCTFCFCPFYPCGDEKKGAYIEGKKGRDVWTCKNCIVIHEPKNMKKIIAQVKVCENEKLKPEERSKMKEKVIQTL